MTPLWLLACRHPPLGDSGTSRPEETTEETATDTSSSDSTGPEPDPLAPVPPSVRITGHAGDKFASTGGLLAIPPFGDDPAVLFASLTVPLPEGPYTGKVISVILPGALPPGDYDLYDVWDGISAYQSTVTSQLVAGDINDDGHLDLWLNSLQFGPFLGRRIEEGIGGVAYLDNGGRYGLTNLDIDGDGHEDLVEGGNNQTAWVHYGPFEGRIAGGNEPDLDPEVTWFGDNNGCSESEGTWVLPDYLGPGRDAIAVGTDENLLCEVDTTIWELYQPRGTHLGYEDRVGFASGIGVHLPISGTGDIDGDGFGDLIYGDRIGSFLLKGPLQGNAWYISPNAFSQVNGYVHQAVGDINGDGIQEIVGVWDRAPGSGDITDQSWVLLFSPYTEPVDLASGLHLAIQDELGNDLGENVADLDGDGLPDLIVSFMYVGGGQTPSEDLLDAGSILIFYGRDLLAAELARHE